MSEEKLDQQNQQQEGGSDKITKKYDSSMSKLMAMLNGKKDLFKKVKVSKSDADIIIEELLKEKKEKALADFKTQALALIESHVAFEKFQKEETKKFEDAINKKKKEFSEEAERVFNLLEDIRKMEEEYKATLTNLASGSEEKK